MQLATLRRMVVATIALLLFYQVGTWMAVLFGGLWGGLSAVAVAAVSILCARLARGGTGKTAWFLVPTLLFTVVPLLARIWKTFTTAQSNWFDHVVAITPLLVGFVIPVVLLLLIYTDLRRKTL